MAGTAYRLPMIMRTALGLGAFLAVLAGCGFGNSDAEQSPTLLGAAATCGDWLQASPELQRTTARADIDIVRESLQQSVRTSPPPPASDDRVAAILPDITRSCTAAGDGTELVTVFSAVMAGQPSYDESRVRLIP